MSATGDDEELPREELERRVAEVGFWWHSLPLSDEVITPGHKTPEIIEQEWQNLGITDLTGKSVLDVGAWDGYFSFRSEAVGASRVVALDHHMWGVDRRVAAAHHERERAEGLPLTPLDEIPGASGHYDTLPGRQGFDLAREVFGSRVEAVVADFTTDDLSGLGEFDVVLFLGVLYHFEDPMAAMRRLAGLTREMAVIETHAIVTREMEAEAAWSFAADAQHGPDRYWWAPNLQGLVSMCHTAGFSRVVPLQGPPEDPSQLPGPMQHIRLTVQAFK